MYTLPVDSWQNAVLGSYQTAVGILEFVNFLLAKQSLATPIVGDKYWVGLFRRHQVKFGSGKNITVTDDVHVNHMKHEKTPSILNEKTMCSGVLNRFAMNRCCLVLFTLKLHFNVVVYYLNI